MDEHSFWSTLVARSYLEARWDSPLLQRSKLRISGQHGRTFLKPILMAAVRVFYAAKSGTYTTRDRRFTGMGGALDIKVILFCCKRETPVSKPPTLQCWRPGALFSLLFADRVRLKWLVWLCCHLSSVICMIHDVYIYISIMSSSAQAQQLEISLSWCNVAILGWYLPSTMENLRNRLTKSMLGSLDFRIQESDQQIFQLSMCGSTKPAQQWPRPRQATKACGVLQSLFVGTNGIQIVLKPFQDVSQKQNRTIIL